MEDFKLLMHHFNQFNMKTFTSLQHLKESKCLFRFKQTSLNLQLGDLHMEFVQKIKYSSMKMIEITRFINMFISCVCVQATEETEGNEKQKLI